MNKQYAVGDYRWETVSEVIDMVNHNCDADKEERIPMKIVNEDKGWFIECLNEEDEPRLEKHLRYIYGLDEPDLSTLDERMKDIPEICEELPF